MYNNFTNFFMRTKNSFCTIIGKLKILLRHLEFTFIHTFDNGSPLQMQLYVSIIREVKIDVQSAIQ